VDLEVVIEGVSDPRLASEIKQKTRRCAGTSRAPVSGAQRCRDRKRGQWDLGVRGPFVRRFASFTKRSELLAELVAEHLRACL